MSIRIPRNLVIIFILTVLAIGSTTYYSYKNVVLTSQSGKTVSQAKENLFFVERVSGQLDNVEESVGRALLTGDKRYFSEYESNRQILSQQIASLKDFEKDDSAEEQNALNLEAHLNTTLGIIDSALRIGAFSPDITRKYIGNGKGKANIDEIKNILNRMKERESSLIALKQQENNKAVYKSVQAILISAALALLLVLWLLYLLNADIAERKKVEKLALENEKKYRNIFEHVGDVVYTSDIKGYFKMLNPRITDVTGYAPKELIGKHFSFIIAPEWLEEVKQYYAYQFANNIPETLKEFQVVTKTGERKWIEQKVVMLKEGGKTADFQCTARDITERKNMETALVQSNKKFQNIFNSSPFAISITELKTGKILDINDEFTSMFGYTKEDVNGCSTIDIGMLTEDDRNKIIEDLAVYGYSKNREFKFRSKSGVVIACLYSNILLDIDGTPCILVLYSNITALKRLENALAESNKKYLTIFSSSLQPACVSEIRKHDKPGIITEANNAFCELFKVKKTDVIEHTLTELELVSNEEISKVLSEADDKKLVMNYEIKMQTYTGENITCLISFNYVQLGESLYRIWIFNNISERKKLENELVAAKEKAEESTRAKELFVANMSHEIRTPMTGIMGLTELLQRTHLSAEQKEYLDGIKHSSESLLIIINEVLDIAKINAGKIVFEKIPFSLYAIVKNVAFTLEPRAVQKGIQLRYKIDASVPEKVVGDSVRLSQILWNLAGNAIKFTEKGFVEIGIIKLSEENDKVRLLFTIKDTGIGIPEHRLADIFEEFTQADTSTSRKYGGTGLGLPIANKLVELQGGTISVESEEKEGSTFRFSLEYGIYFKQLNPIAIGSSDKADDEAQLTDHVDLTGLNVLLAEDNKINQSICRKILTSKGAEVDIVEDGKQAIEKLRSKIYDIILMDIQMPEMDGYEATRFIRSKMEPPKSNIPVIALTAFAMEGENEKCLAAGMNGYVSKPFKADELYARILQFTTPRKNRIVKG